ncbi:uncharacterized protein EAF02_003993 [Botrytis sinoallii]|uniref:uncharacterized protein n=1 Tax=Botrytis sinoallii TaxID=1463999 RepID=UPI0018FF3225|nr:uncharacterized protein EAF02_003993 [Botrytis sinoallii]KAF7885484.1 hypothetical protein EAF02_003993 [Botrytis sinoallii]
MSKPTDILIEKLKLQCLLREKVFVTWKDQSEILLVIPPNADFANSSRSHLMSDIDSLSRLDASAIHDTEISDSIQVLCIQFDLDAKGFVVMKKKKTAATIKA